MYVIAVLRIAVGAHGQSENAVSAFSWIVFLRIRIFAAVFAALFWARARSWIVVLDPKGAFVFLLAIDVIASQIRIIRDRFHIF